MRPWPTVTAESGAMFATVRHRTLDAIIISASPKTSNCPTRGCRKIKPLRPAEAGGFRQPACIFSKERDEGEFPGRGFSWLLHSLEDRIRVRCIGRKSFAKRPTRQICPVSRFCPGPGTCLPCRAFVPSAPFTGVYKHMFARPSCATFHAFPFGSPGARYLYALAFHVFHAAKYSCVPCNKQVYFFYGAENSYERTPLICLTAKCGAFPFPSSLLRGSLPVHPPGVG